MADTDPIGWDDLSALAKGLIRITAPYEFREALLGDLQEDAATRHFATRRHANLWLWKQVIRSLPSLFGYRLQRVTFVRLACLLAANLFAFFALTFWDTEVSRTIVGTLANQSDPPGLNWLRATYFVLFAAGACLAGFLTAPLGFKRQETFLYNVLICFGPIYLIINIAIFYPLFSTGRLDALPYLGTRSLILGVTLMMGAYLFSRIRAALLSK